MTCTPTSPEWFSSDGLTSGTMRSIARPSLSSFEKPAASKALSPFCGCRAPLASSVLNERRGGRRPAPMGPFAPGRLASNSRKDQARLPAVWNSNENLLRIWAVWAGGRELVQIWLEQLAGNCREEVSVSVLAHMVLRIFLFGLFFAGPLLADFFVADVFFPVFEAAAVFLAGAFFTGCFTAAAFFAARLPTAFLAGFFASGSFAGVPCDLAGSFS